MVPVQKSFMVRLSYIKLIQKDKFASLPIKSKKSNINSSIYDLSKHKVKLVAPLRESQYSIKYTKDFTSKIKNKKAPYGCHLVSFNEKSICTYVLSDILWKVSVFRVILVLIYLYSVKMWENVDLNNSEYWHFPRSEIEPFN